jgi:hypothetical protein
MKGVSMKFFKVFCLVCLLIVAIHCKKSDSVNDGNNVENELIVYSNVTLGGVSLKDTMGSYFSTSTGTVYTAGDLAGVGSTIDLVFVGIFGMRFFESPDDDLINWGLDNVPDATNTKIINYIESSGINFTVEMFDNMTDSTPLNNLTITEDNESFPQSTPRIVLFQNSKGLKGAIKITEIASGAGGHIVFSIKMQKYAH